MYVLVFSQACFIKVSEGDAVDKKKDRRGHKVRFSDDKNNGQFLKLFGKQLSYI